MSIALASMLRPAASTLNIESNVVRAAGIEALAEGLSKNLSLRTLKMANLHAPGSNQVIMLKAAVEMRLANAVDVHPSLLKLTADLRHVPAKDVVRRALERNNDIERARVRVRAPPLEPRNVTAEPVSPAKRSSMGGWRPWRWLATKEDNAKDSSSAKEDNVKDPGQLYQQMSGSL